MPQHHITPKSYPVGTQLIRLKDIPEPQLGTAARACMREAKDPAEWLRFYELWHQPGSASGRIAA
jgi:hypothetical protein